ncbi:hypothetical protein H5410_029658 [Solanum commersonii]|uniref:Uncharacterized protein n=1 Tax=Solanum commersonii TaxID=4109 RepID=A0A9J5YF89_SOLCO|nr:hypothetical protein H5410_029658 [Solanum commersonii]
MGVDVGSVSNLVNQFWCKDLSTNEDNIFWYSDKQGRFSVGSAYRSSQRPGTHIGGWPWKMIWKVKDTIQGCTHSTQPREKRFANLFQAATTAVSSLLLCDCSTTFSSIFGCCQATARDSEVVADFHQLKGHQLNYAKEHQRSSSLLEQRWESVRTHEVMEDCPYLHLVVYMDGEEPEMF